MVQPMRTPEQKSTDGTNHEIRRRAPVCKLPGKAEARGQGQVQVLGFTDPADAEAALQRGETLTAFWDGKQVCWK